MDNFVRDKTYESLLGYQRKLTRNFLANIILFITIILLVVTGDSEERVKIPYIGTEVDYLTGTTISLFILAFLVLRHQMMFLHTRAIQLRVKELLYGSKCPKSFWSIQSPSFSQIVQVSPIYPAPVKYIGIVGAISYGFTIHFGILALLVAIHNKAHPTIYSFVLSIAIVSFVVLSFTVMHDLSSTKDAKTITKLLDLYDREIFK